ncbi:MAG: hypothetical protein LBB81_03540 [Treponema sp.]|jgi:hypothetical protein|nr:hypothetical protein [Treponema sp.]
MFQSVEKKRFYPIVVSILVIAIFGTFAFSITEIPNTPHGLAGNKPYSKGIFSPVDHTIDWLAEDTPTVGRTNKTSSSAMRNALPRLLIPVEIHSSAKYLIAFCIHTAKSNYFHNNKNTIQLNLRI